MMKMRLISFAVVALANFSRAEDVLPPAPAPTPAFAPADHFAVRLFTHAASLNHNVVLSPYGLAEVLAMMGEGARGSTKSEMKSLLGADASAPLLALDGDNTLKSATRVWVQKDYPLRDEFMKAITKKFGSGVESIDLLGDTAAATKTINAWVAKNTERKITQLIEESDIEELILTSAVYFRGRWEHPFEKTLTKKEDFAPIGGAKLKANFMHRHGKYGYAETEDAKILDLPYAGGGISMIVLLPKEPKGLASFERALKADALEAALATLKPEEVSVHLPRFKITSARMELKPVLMAMGLKAAFEKGADFSGMTGTKELRLEKIFQKALIEVDEKGTEAAAATGGAMMGAIMMKPSPPREFNADHPFAFMIRDNATKRVIFMGHLLKP